MVSKDWKSAKAVPIFRRTTGCSAQPQSQAEYGTNSSRRCLGHMDFTEGKLCLTSSLAFCDEMTALRYWPESTVCYLLWPWQSFDTICFFMLRINCKGYRYKDTHLCGKRSRWTHWVSKGPLGCWKLLTAWATAVRGCWLSPSVLARVRLHLQNRPVWASTVWEAAQRLKWAQWSTQVVSS